MTRSDGIHYGVPMAEYLAWDAVNQSSLKTIIDSPAHCYHAMTEDREPTEPLMAGGALHVAALEPDRFAAEYVEWVKVKGKGPAAFAADQAATPLSLYSSDWCIPEMVKALRDDPHAGALLAGLHGRAEVSILWTDTTGVRCKARLDGLFPRLTWDLKSISDIPTDRNCQRAAMTYRYPFQFAFQRRGLLALGEPERDAAIVFIEKSAPHTVNTFWMTGDILKYGDAQVNKALAKYRHCTATGVWPGPGEKGTKEMGLPAWAAVEEGILTEEAGDGW